MSFERAALVRAAGGSHARGGSLRRRARRAQALGARAVINAGQTHVPEALGREHGTGDLYGIPVVQSSVFIEATGVSSVFEEIVRIAPHSARVVVVSLHKKPALLDLQFLLMKELVARGSIGYPREFPDVIAMLADPAVDVTPIARMARSYRALPA